MRLGWLFLLAGCARPVVVPPAAPKPVVSVAPARALAPPPRGLFIEVNTDPNAENHVFVDLRFDGINASRRAFRPLHDLTLSDLTERDDGCGSVHVHYALTFKPSADPIAPASEPIELQAAGEDLFALPDLEDRVPVQLKLRTGGSVTGGASSFGLGADQRFEARPSELRSAYFLAGDVGTAQFHAGDGNDFTEPPLALLVAAAKRDEPPVSLTARTRGFFASTDRRAVWTAPTRILIAQALAQRYVGGFLWVGARDPATPAKGWFFSEGFSRTVGREVLFDAGMIDAHDRARELNELLAAIAEGGAPDSRRVAMANGALLATALDVAARKKHSGLQQFLRERLAEAATKKSDTIAQADFIARAREGAGDAFADAMTATLARGAEVPLPPDLLGRCWRLERKPLVPFELGFVSSAGEELTVQSVKPRSRAEAAGVRTGDVVVNLDYRNGQSGTRVKMTVRRGEKTIPITFSPAGTAKPGRIFERVAGIPDDRC